MSERDNLPRWDGRRDRYEVWFLTLSHADADYRITVRAQRRPGGWSEVTEIRAEGTAHAEWAGRAPAAAVRHELLEAA